MARRMYNKSSCRFSQASRKEAVQLIAQLETTQQVKSAWIWGQRDPKPPNREAQLQNMSWASGHTARQCPYVGWVLAPHLFRCLLLHKGLAGN
eukprot:2709640-Amphidinium_carterae.1